MSMMFLLEKLLKSLKVYSFHYFAFTVSNITNVALDELEKWHNRLFKY